MTIECTQRIGFVSDIHGNSTALRAVLNDMPPVDSLACLGDVVGYGPRPGVCVDLIREHSSITLYGNHEKFLTESSMQTGNSDASAGIVHALEKLSDEQLEWTQSLPYNTTLNDGDLLIAHGYPSNETPYEYITPGNATKLVPHSREHNWKYLAVGHSHIQFKLDLSKFHDEAGIVFNPGSVGQPRDNDPRAAYAVLDCNTGDVTLCRVEYDIDRVIEQIHTAGLPRASGERLREGKYPEQPRYRF